ncbi:MAG: hypothetical protein LBU51_01365 [Bacteroidales bacterium]|nr:hypothetical protein [Bacteroidales bacterium]
METLLNTDFFSHIKNDDNTDIQNVYGNFIEVLFSFCKSAGDTISAYFVLNYTRIEFVSIQNSVTEYNSGKKRNVGLPF